MGLLNHENETVLGVIKTLPAHIVELLDEQGIVVRVLAPDETFKTASKELSNLHIDIDGMKPSGLFVVRERTVYVRRLERGVIAHELGHALDCALGKGFYVSGYTAKILNAFHSALQFVTFYATAGVDEFFAECFRAYLGENGGMPTMIADRALLGARNPEMLAYFDELFAGIIA
jgi:hypothetical protein